MTLVEKISLLNFDAKEEKKVKQKFLATLSLVNEEELRERLDFLKSKNVKISKGKEVKVLAIPVEELAKKFSILEEIHETDLYVSDPNFLLLNVIDIYKKIKYCIQNNIEYKWKKEDNQYKYADFLKSENKWKEFVGSKDEKNVSEEKFGLDDSLVTLEPFSETPVAEQTTENLFQEFSTPLDYNFNTPNTEDNLVKFSELTTPQIEKPVKFENTIESKESKESKDLKESTEEFKTTNLADIRAELERELQELDKIKNTQAEPDEISFNDIEPDSYGMGGRAA